MRKTKAAKQLRKRLGDGWKAYVCENLGWYFCAATKGGRIQVHLHKNRYTAYLGNVISFRGGNWVFSSSSPEKAVLGAIKMAKNELVNLQNLLKGLE